MFYELFLLVFPPQPNDPHRLVTRSFRYGVTLTTPDPMISRLFTRALPTEPQSFLNQKRSLYTTFIVYFQSNPKRDLKVIRRWKDYKPPLSFFVQRWWFPVFGFPTHLSESTCTIFSKNFFIDCYTKIKIEKSKSKFFVTFFKKKMI